MNHVKINYFISPHPDDICYSAFGSLMSVPGHEPKRIVTVFSKSCWTYLRTPSPANWREVTAQRLKEDEAFARSSGCDLVHLGLKDTSLRGYQGGREYLVRPDEDPVSAEVEHRLGRVIAVDAERSVFYVPIGISNHLDHLIVRDALIRILKILDNFIFYEDLPYACEKSEEEIANFARSLCMSLTPRMVPLSGLWAGKLEGIRTYASQLEPDTITRIASYADRLGGQGEKAERVWSVRGAVAPACPAGREV